MVRLPILNYQEKYMTNMIAHKIKSVRASAAVEHNRIIALVGEAEVAMRMPTQRDCAFFAYSICLNSRSDLDGTLTDVREVEAMLERQEKDKDALTEVESIRLKVLTALVERRIKTITDNLNAARLTLDGEIDIWGKRLPTEGLWSK